MINPLTPGTFCRKCIFWTFRWFLGWILALLPLIRWKKRLQHNSWPFLAPASRFSALWLAHVQKSKFWAFLCISKAPLGPSLWSGHHWKDLLLLQKLSVDDANFGQKRWRQKRKKGQGLSRVVTGGTGVNGLSIFFYKSHLFWIFWLE